MHVESYLFTLVLHAFKAQYSNHSLHTTFLFIAMVGKPFSKKSNKSEKKSNKSAKLKDQRTNDANYIIPIENPKKEDIIIPYVFFSCFRS